MTYHWHDVARSLLYHISFIALTLVMGVACLPFLLMGKRSALAGAIPYRWTACALWLQRHVLRLDYVVRRAGGHTGGGAVYAVKHQSAWETMALWHMLERPVFVLKKELVDIPVFGWYLGRADNIVIDRRAAKKATAQIIAQGKDYVAQGRTIVIFPEGTRTAPGQKARYKAGIAALYEALGDEARIYPVALNAGCFWPRNGFIRKAGTVEVEVLPPITAGLEKGEFMQRLHTDIETASDRLATSPKFLTSKE